MKLVLEQFSERSPIHIKATTKDRIKRNARMYSRLTIEQLSDALLNYALDEFEEGGVAIEMPVRRVK